MPRLLDKEIVRVAGKNEIGAPAYETTVLGHELIKSVMNKLQIYKYQIDTEEAQKTALDVKGNLRTDLLIRDKRNR